MHRHSLIWLTKATAILLLLVSCSPEPDWRLQDASEMLPPLAFSLTDHEGNMVTAADYRGSIVLLFFGFASCPDVCPTTLATLAQAIADLNAEPGAVRVLFVTVDPERDQSELLREYVQAFGPQFAGLRGNAGQLAELAGRYGVFYELGQPDASGNYPVAHGSSVYVFDRSGRARLIGSGSDPVAAYTHDLSLLLETG